MVRTLASFVTSQKNAMQRTRLQCKLLLN